MEKAIVISLGALIVMYITWVAVSLVRLNKKISEESKYEKR